MWDECGIGLCATMLKMLGRCGIFTGPHNFYNFFQLFIGPRYLGFDLWAGVHKSFHPTIRDGSTWSKFGARGEHGERGKDGKHGDVLRFSNLGVLRFSENRALVLGEPCSGSRRTVL